ASDSDSGSDSDSSSDSDSDSTSDTGSDNDSDSDSNSDSESGSNNNVVPPNSPKNGTNASNKNEAKDSKEPLPDTGSEDEANTSLIWGLLASLGSLLLFRRKKENKDKK
ncbi:TPA: LPXTG cell wall anchor domain-containing protein, partial [Staphylococcus aureus]|nr:LPXTG cell wall anchor domain-containing protein [Staphylococcus aureus]